MHTHYHGDFEVEWTDGEWDRLQRIKRWKEGRPSTAKRARCSPNTAQVQLYLSPELRDKARSWARARGMTVSAVLRHVCMILTEGA